MSQSYAQSVRVRHKVKEFYHVVVVVERLSDSHHNYAVNSLARIVSYSRDLPEYLRWGKIPHSSVKVDAQNLQPIAQPA